MLKTWRGWNHKQRMAGAKVVNEAIAAGRLEPPTVCNRCGRTEGVLYHAHEYGEKVMDNLEPLCRKCHMVVHWEHRDMEAAQAYWDAVARGEHPKASFKRKVLT